MVELRHSLRRGASTRWHPCHRSEDPGSRAIPLREGGGRALRGRGKGRSHWATEAPAEQCTRDEALCSREAQCCGAAHLWLPAALLHGSEEGLQGGGVRGARRGKCKQHFATEENVSPTSVRPFLARLVLLRRQPALHGTAVATSALRPPKRAFSYPLARCTTSSLSGTPSWR